MDKVKYLCSKFNSFESKLQLDENNALNIIYNYDNRLCPKYSVNIQGFSYYGGIYKEANDTTNDINLFAVEFYGYNNIVVKGESRNFIAAIATNINYQIYSLTNYECDLNLNGQYISVFQFNDSIAKGIKQIKDTLTVEGLVLIYVGKNFSEAILEICNNYIS